MSTATFRFKGELDRLLSPGRRGRDLSVVFQGNPSAKHLIETRGIPHTELGLLLFNGFPATSARAVYDGDLVEVFPRERAADRPPRFAADVHLGRLARLLRLLGLDASYSNAVKDEELIAAAGAEGRLILTRDRGLLMRAGVVDGYLVRSLDPYEQLAELAAGFISNDSIAPFSRCIGCNGPLEAADKPAVEGCVPAVVFERYRKFFRCADCGKIYWKGDHFANIARLLERIRLETGLDAAGRESAGGGHDQSHADEDKD